MIMQANQTAYHKADCERPSLSPSSYFTALRGSSNMTVSTRVTRRSELAFAQHGFKPLLTTARALTREGSKTNKPLMAELHSSHSNGGHLQKPYCLSQGLQLHRKQHRVDCVQRLDRIALLWPRFALRNLASAVPWPCMALTGPCHSLAWP